MCTFRSKHKHIHAHINITCNINILCLIPRDVKTYYPLLRAHEDLLVPHSSTSIVYILSHILIHLTNTPLVSHGQDIRGTPVYVVSFFPGLSTDCSQLGGQRELPNHHRSDHFLPYSKPCKVSRFHSDWKTLCELGPCWLWGLLFYTLLFSSHNDSLTDLGTCLPHMHLL